MPILPHACGHPSTAIHTSAWLSGFPGGIAVPSDYVYPMPMLMSAPSGVVGADAEIPGLGDIHGDVRPLQQHRGVDAVLPGEHYSDAGFHIKGDPVDQERGLECVPQRGADILGRCDVGDVREQDGELVTAEPGNGVGLVQHRTKPGADLFQQLVTVVVTEGVVDLLEPVQIDEQQSDCRAGALSRSELLAATVKEQHAVRQTGQGIVKRVAQRLTPFTVQ